MPSQSRHTSQTSQDAQNGTKASPTVLVVEDEVLIRLDVAEELRVSGFAVAEASSAEEALDLLASGLQVDIIFSDLRLLGSLSGWDLCKAVKAHYPDVPFLLTSAQDPPAEAKAERVPFVPKPYQPDNVVELIAKTTKNITDENGSR